MFVLLARDPDFLYLVTEWATRREREISFGKRPESDRELVKEARQCAIDGDQWRRNNLYKWRDDAKPKPPQGDVVVEVWDKGDDGSLRRTRLTP